MISGSCMCGAVRFEIEGRVTGVQICYAERCQKYTGSAFAPEMAVRSERFRWLCGEELITHYEAPILREPPPLRRCFCKICGSPTPVVRPGDRFVGLFAGMLDGDPELRVAQQIFTGFRPAWSRVGDDVPSFEGRAPAANRLKMRD